MNGEFKEKTITLTDIDDSSKCIDRYHCLLINRSHALKCTFRVVFPNKHFAYIRARSYKCK